MGISRRFSQILRRLNRFEFIFVNLRSFVLKNLWEILLIFLILDVAYSFFQHSQTYLDGDIANIVMPSPSYNKVLTDPFGVSAMKGEMYPGPNRYFAHAGMSAYFKSVPFLFQYIDTPINSVYWAAALIKILIQVLIISLLAIYISHKNSNKNACIIAAALITPLFQTTGYNLYMGIIDRSITYNFFYALPLGLLLLYFLPFYKEKYSNNSISSWIMNFGLFIFMVFLSFNGPLIQPVILILFPVILLYKSYTIFQIHENIPFLKRIWLSIALIPKQMLFFFIVFCLFSLYSIYLGTFNSENLTNIIPLAERYARLPLGLFNMLTQRIGFALFVAVFILNIVIIFKLKKVQESQNLVHILKWIAYFALIYLLLLPLGGYRNYRPNIVRYDTFMPILLAMFFFYGKSTLFIISHLTEKKKAFYLATILVFSGIMTFADKPTTYLNDCEKVAFETISHSSEKIVALENDCKVMAWEKITDPNYSETNARLLHYWGITKDVKLYYQK